MATSHSKIAYGGRRILTEIVKRESSKSSFNEAALRELVAQSIVQKGSANAFPNYELPLW